MRSRHLVFSAGRATKATEEMHVARAPRSHIVLLLALMLLLPGAGRAGGSPIGFVSLPERGVLAVIALPNGGTLARISVAGTPGHVAASVNGRRVLVASPDAGAVTQIDGVEHRVVRVFRGLTKPVAVALDYDPPIGIVTPRFAFALDSTPGVLVVLDLARGRIAARLPVGARPDGLACDGATLWITHSGSGTLTRVNVATPARPRLLASVDAGAPVAALVADPQEQSVFVALRGSGAVARFEDGAARARPGYRRIVSREPLAGLALAPRDVLVAAERHGALHLLREQTGREVSRLQAPPGIEAIDVYGGWLVATLPRGLSLIAVPDGSMRTAVRLDARVGGFAWAVL